MFILIQNWCDDRKHARIKKELSSDYRADPPPLVYTCICLLVHRNSSLYIPQPGYEIPLNIDKRKKRRRKKEKSLNSYIFTIIAFWAFGLHLLHLYLWIWKAVWSGWKKRIWFNFITFWLPDNSSAQDHSSNKHSIY